MNLTYKILWIDNDLQSYIDNGEVKSVADFLSDRGFEPIIETVLDEANLDISLSKYDYDLIISDYNLENTTGDVVIENIRNTKHLDTEILFYTAQSSYKTKTEVKERLAFIERLTFQIGRETLLDKIEKVISLTLQKLIELNATRGLITAATSDLDVEIENIYNIVINLPVNESLQHKIAQIFKTDYKEVSKNLLNRCKSQRINHISDYLNYFALSDSFRKWDIVKELLKLHNFAGFDLDLFKQYKTDIIEIRNKFAHAKAEEIEGKIVLKSQLGKEDFEFDEAKCIEIRKKLISHKKNIAGLKNILNQTENKNILQ